MSDYAHEYICRDTFWLALFGVMLCIGGFKMLVCYLEVFRMSGLAEYGDGKLHQLLGKAP